MIAPDEGSGPLVELSFHGRKLRNMDFLSKSDPFVVMFVGDQSALDESQFRMVGRTETIWDNLNPDFVTKLYLPLKRSDEENTRVLLQYYDQDSKESLELSKEYLKKQDFIGQVMFNVVELLSVDHKLLSMKMSNRSFKADPKAGTSIITAEELADRSKSAQYLVEFRFTADCEMPKRKKIFVILWRSVKHPTSLGPPWIPIYRTGAMDAPPKSGQEFKFQDFSLTREQLNACDDSRTLRIELFTYKKSGAHTLQGYVELSISKLRQVESDFMFPIQLQKDGSLLSGYLFQPGSMTSSNSATLGIHSSLRFCFTRLTWRNRF